MKKSLCLYFLWLIMISASSQTLYTGIITDENNYAIESVSIRIEGEGIGTISDSKGYFSLSIPYNLQSYPLIFSHVNFKRKEVALNTLTSEKLEIKMQKEEKQLNEIEILPTISKTKLEKKGGFYLGKTHIRVLGTETGIVLSLKGKAMPRQISFKVKACSYDSIIAKANIYKFDKKTKEVGDVIFSGPVTIFKNIQDEGETDEEDMEYTVNIDNPVLLTDEDIFLSVIFPASNEDGIFAIPAYLGQGYARKDGRTNLIKGKFHNGISLQVTYLK